MVDASTRWTAGRLCSESLQSLHSVPTTNTPQQKSHCVRKFSQLVSVLYLFSVFHSILCVLLSYLVEKQNCSEQSTGPGIIAGLRAGRSALQWQPWNHNWRQQTSVTVFVWLCVYLCRISLLEYWTECYSDFSVTPGMMINWGTDEHFTNSVWWTFYAIQANEEIRRPHASCSRAVCHRWTSPAQPSGLRPHSRVPGRERLVVGRDFIQF